MRNLTMPADFKNFGLIVITDAGFATRGREYPRNPDGSVNHHTACRWCGDLDVTKCEHLYPSGQILLTGRPDVPGPLANAGQQRDDVVHAIASGKSNNAGAGGWKGLDSNYDVHGLEIEFSGVPAEPFPRRRFETAARIHAAWAWRLGYGADMVCQHWEWAPDRKIDLLRSALAPHGGTQGFRDRVQDLRDHPPHLQIEQQVPVVNYNLDRTLKVGDRDTHDNRIVTHVENLLLWNAVKRGHPGSGPGRIARGDQLGEFTTVTGDSVEKFRAWWWDNFEAHRPPAKRHLRSREGREVGRKVYDALNLVATADLDDLLAAA